jgi:hypothetical protein
MPQVEEEKQPTRKAEALKFRNEFMDELEKLGMPKITGTAIVMGLVDTPGLAIYFADAAREAYEKNIPVKEAAQMTAIVITMKLVKLAVDSFNKGGKVTINNDIRI